jgi:RNA-binding protein
MEKTKDTPQATLSPKQKKYLKGLGHHLSPVILIGKEALSEKLIEATSLELANHELIKVKIGNNSGVGKQDAAFTLTNKCSCHLVQLIGKTLLLYKENTEKPKDERIQLPKVQID